VPASAGSSGGTAEDFQHPHLATITAASIASFNAAAASGGSFVPPSPIGSYNPVFQQIYHHAAAASVQPKPAHYASSAVSTPHRQLQLPSSLDKQLSSFQNQAAVSAAAAAVVNNVASNYYGENSSSSGASPSPTTVALTSTSLTWNTPNMISNTFLAMQQQQQQQQAQQQQQQAQQQQQQAQQQQLNLVADKVVSRILLFFVRLADHNLLSVNPLLGKHTNTRSLKPPQVLSHFSHTNITSPPNQTIKA